ncbi:putative uncharacterized protein WWC2-AS2 [Pongo pygmaeus]|uniref:putative uncharacterized protein WWC2-AS2 n=1 Tax=Pongo pygmaeus TaxID=9600 RepID=UPI00300C4D9D
MSPHRSPAVARRFGRPRRRDPRRRRTPALPRPWPGRGGPGRSLLHRHLFIQQLLRAGRHCRGTGRLPQAGQCRVQRWRGLDPKLQGPQPLSQRGRLPGPGLFSSRVYTTVPRHLLLGY